MFRYTLRAATICFVVATISLWIGMYPEWVASQLSIQNQELLAVKPMFQGEDLANIGSSLCTFSGQQHLYWQFPYHHLFSYRPNWFTWLLLVILPHFFKQTRTTKKIEWFVSGEVLGYGLLSGYIVAALYSWKFGIHHEILSTWCLFNMLWLMLPYLLHLVVLPLLGVKVEYKQKRK